MELDSILGDIDYSIIIVNDGSTNLNEQPIYRILDENSKIAYYSYPVNKGKGHALRFGVSKTEADFYIYTDFDFPFGCAVIKTLFSMLNTTQSDLVIGKRGIEYFEQLPFRRRLISSMLLRVNYSATGRQIADTQAGIKGFRKSVRQIFLSTKTNGFLFELEFIKKCISNNVQYSFVEVLPRPDIHFTDFRPQVIYREAVNLIKILAKT
jgi:glycosyltransferase involved in cell wall biosynthesis